MGAIKSFFSFIVFLLIAIGFFALIRFEIDYGVAGGKFGGANVDTMPGTFYFLIGAQTFVALYLIVSAIKELWNLSQRNIQESKRKSPVTIVALYWLSATFFFVILNLLAVWSAIEMFINAYQLLDEFEMPKKAIFGGLFLICFGVLCNVFYQFLFRSLVETFYTKARSSFEVLRRSRPEVK